MKYANYYSTATQHSFPLTFPSNVYQVVISLNGDNSESTMYKSLGIQTVNKSYFVARNHHDGTASGRYIAIGYYSGENLPDNPVTQ